MHQQPAQNRAPWEDDLSRKSKGHFFQDKKVKSPFSSWDVTMLQNQLILSQLILFYLILFPR